MNSLKLEGEKANIRVNAVAPVAATRMTENILPPEAAQMLQPEYVTPGVVYLCSEDAPNGAILAAGAGVFAVAKISETRGAYLGRDERLTVEAVRDNWDKISDDTGAKAYWQGGEQTFKFFEVGKE